MDREGDCVGDCDARADAIRPRADDGTDACDRAADHRVGGVAGDVEAGPVTDLEVLLDYLSQQWLPPPIKEAFDRVAAGHDELMACRQEIERLRARMKPDAAYF